MTDKTVSACKEREKDCYCHLCDKDFHHLGIMSHRAAHRTRNQNCKITYSSGVTKLHNFGAKL